MQSKTVWSRAARSIRTFVSTASSGGFGMVRSAIDHGHPALKQAMPLLVRISIRLRPRLFGNDGAQRLRFWFCALFHASTLGSWICSRLFHLKQARSKEPYRQCNFKTTLANFLAQYFLAETWPICQSLSN